ncbi:MAG: hypothetical protein RL616_830, partial [Verrucomicrobiota bacterium]
MPDATERDQVRPLVIAQIGKATGGEISRRSPELWTGILTNADVGVFGYYQKQFTDSSPAANSFKDSEAAGLGPEISFRLPRWDLSVSVRYAYEFTAYNRPKGHAFNLTLAKKF